MSSFSTEPEPVRPRVPLRECHACGLVQGLPRVPPAHRALCIRCGITLARPRRAGFDAALVCAVCGSAFLALALLLPLMNIREVGRFSLVGVLSGPEMLARQRLQLLAAAVAVTFLVVPALRLGLLLVTLIGLRARMSPRLLAWAYGWARRMAPYGMLDVFLLGFTVAFVRLSAIAHAELGPAVLAIAGAMLATSGVEGCVHPDEVWDTLGRRRGAQSAASAAGIGCLRCALFNDAIDGARCSRCDAVLHKRKPDSVSRSWALVLAGVLLYVPANVLPMMYVEHLGSGGASTILGGVMSLLRAGAWPIGLIVFVASVSVPLLKLFALGGALVLEHLGARRGVRVATMAHHLVGAIGRWSMLDTFALATLVGLIHMGALAQVRPGAAALPFCMLALVTMIAAELFDTRLMWDAAERQSTKGEADDS